MTVAAVCSVVEPSQGAELHGVGVVSTNDPSESIAVLPHRLGSGWVRVSGLV